MFFDPIGNHIIEENIYTCKRNTLAQIDVLPKKCIFI